MASVLMSQPSGLPAPAATAKRGNKILADQYEVSVKLGAGLQGQVYLGKDLQSGNLVALKCMDRAAIEANPKVMQNVERELQAMTKVSEHSGVVQALDIKWKAEWPRSNGGVKPIILLVLELASKCELFDFAMHTGPFPETVAQHYFKQLSSTLQYCHSKGVYHRDLKPENLLINDNYDLKVADFGLAAVTEDAHGIVSVLKTKCGTKGYMAPEVLERNAGYHGGPADVWSSAVILFIMVAGFPPLAVAQRGDWWFDRIRNRQWSHFWAAHERSATFTPAFKDLMQNMFNANPAERATVDDILQHAWLNGDLIETSTVQAEMARRWAVVESKKSAERSKAAESSTGDLDLLGGGITRGAGGPTAAPLPALPMGGLTSGHANSFFAPGTASEIADALTQAFSGSGASHVQSNKADGEVSVQGVMEGMGVVATVYEDGGAHLVSFAPAGVSADGSILSDDEEGDFMGTEADFRTVVASVQSALTGSAAASSFGSTPAAPSAAAADGGDSFSELM